MVVGEHAAVDTRRRDAGEVIRVHTIAHGLRVPVVARCNGGLEVDDPNVGPDRGELVECFTPDVRKVDASWDRARAGFGEPNVLPGIPDPPLEEAGIPGVGQDLVDPSPRHDVAAQEERDGFRAAEGRPCTRRMWPQADTAHGGVRVGSPRRPEIGGGGTGSASRCRPQRGGAREGEKPSSAHRAPGRDGSMGHVGPGPPVLHGSHLPECQESGLGTAGPSTRRPTYVRASPARP